jgi:hypothetical protein
MDIREETIQRLKQSMQGTHGPHLPISNIDRYQHSLVKINILNFPDGRQIMNMVSNGNGTSFRMDIPGILMLETVPKGFPGF